MKHFIKGFFVTFGIIVATSLGISFLGLVVDNFDKHPIIIFSCIVFIICSFFGFLNYWENRKLN